MTSSAFIAHLLDPLIEPQFAEQDMLLDKTFVNSEDQISRDYLKGFKRSSAYALDWAGDKLLIATKDNALRLFDAERSEEERFWPGEWMSMQCDPNNPHIAAAVSWNGKFRVFDTRSAASTVFDVDLKKTSHTMKEFLVLCWSPDSKHIAVNNRSDQVYLLDLRTPGSLRLGASKNMQHEVNQMVWTVDGESLWIATGGTPGKVHIFPAPSLTNEASQAAVAHQYTTISLAADPTGRYIATGGGDCMVTLWDPGHLVCTRSFGFATQAVTTLGFNRSGSLLAWGTGGSGFTGGERNLTIVGANTGMLYWQDATPAPVALVRWHPQRNVLAYTLNVAQLPDERDQLRDRRMNSRDMAVVHMLKIPE
mmetsp:Transcript_64370/g.123874  ORF Transcript_64370/g.123874 Transcript_64370/m.123874 type:complete len:365 (-) Transcript_64370:20-1114(-)